MTEEIKPVSFHAHVFMQACRDVVLYFGGVKSAAATCGISQWQMLCAMHKGTASEEITNRIYGVNSAWRCRVMRTIRER